MPGGLVRWRRRRQSLHPLRAGRLQQRSSAGCYGGGGGGSGSGSGGHGLRSVRRGVGGGGRGDPAPQPAAEPAPFLPPHVDPDATADRDTGAHQRADKGPHL